MGGGNPNSCAHRQLTCVLCSYRHLAWCKNAAAALLRMLGLLGFLIWVDSIVDGSWTRDSRAATPRGKLSKKLLCSLWRCWRASAAECRYSVSVVVVFVARLILAFLEHAHGAVAAAVVVRAFLEGGRWQLGEGVTLANQSAIEGASAAVPTLYAIRSVARFFECYIAIRTYTTKLPFLCTSIFKNYKHSLNYMVYALLRITHS